MSTDADGKPKQPSGWENEKRRRAENEKARCEDEQRTSGEEVETPYVADFASIPTPDLNDPLDALDYARKLNVMMLMQISTDKHLPTRDRWRLLKEGIQALGLTHSKSLVEAKLGKLARMRNGKPEPTTKRESKNVLPPGSRSRGARQRGRIEAAPESPDGPPPPKNGGDATGRGGDVGSGDEGIH